MFVMHCNVTAICTPYLSNVALCGFHCNASESDVELFVLILYVIGLVTLYNYVSHYSM